MSTLRRQPSDPEDGFWPDNTQERSFWEEAADLPIECESDTAPYYAPAERSSTLSREVPRPDSNPSPSKRKTEILQRGEDDDAYWASFPSDDCSDLESDAQTVEDMISEPENDEEPDLAPTQVSFDFSVTDTCRTSLTSVTSISTTDSISRKRTIDMLDVPDKPDSTLPLPASKVRRILPAKLDLLRVQVSSVKPSAVLSMLPAGPVPLEFSASYVPAVVSSPSVPLSAKPSPSASSSGGNSSTLIYSTNSSSTGLTSVTSESLSLSSTFAKTLARKASSSATKLDDDVGHRHFIISHDTRVQALMDEYCIAWGVQYEIARGVLSGQWKWEDITEQMIQDLQGNNAEAAYRVPYILKGDAIDGPKKVSPLWAELDCEQAAILENCSRGLGLLGDWYGHPNWYGGKIQQIVRVQESKDKSAPPTLILERMQMTRSHRFARHLGSRRLLQLKLPKNYGEKEREILGQKLVLCGRVFVPFSVKDGKAYMLETSEDYDREPAECHGDQYRYSLEQFVAWHNPLKLNGKQPVMKWSTRFDLGLSTSIPVLRFAPENVLPLDDEYAAHDAGSKVPADKIFTDGCGLMNAAALIAITRQLKFTKRPTAVQGRIFGAKGLWVLHHIDRSEDEPPRIWIRPSQLKIHLSPRFPDTHEMNRLHPAHFIFDLVAPSRVTAPARLSRLTIVNLAHHGVPLQVFTNLIKTSLIKEAQALTQWDNMGLLWNAVNRATGSTMAALQELAQGSQRALGFGGSNESWRKDPENEDEDEDDSSSTVAGSSRHYPGGMPVTLGQRVLRLIQAGFTPKDEEFLYDELKKILSRRMSSIIKKYHFTVTQSAEAFIIPDPFGILEPGEIHFTSTQPLNDAVLSSDPYTITGDVLIYRNPARIPSDVQKVRAVYCEALSKYVDVIVLPVQGECSLASLLAGGDMDGDVAVCIFDPALVTPFENSSITSPPDGFLDKNFQPESAVQRVASLHAELSNVSSQRRCKILQNCLLSGLSDAKIGIYSKYHEVMIYARGYDHPETIRNAFMFNTLLDSRKTGLRVLEEVAASDKKKYSYDLPPCMSDTAEADDKEYNYPKRNVRGAFILDQLLDVGKRICDKQLQRYEEAGKAIAFREVRHDDMLKPYTNKVSVHWLSPELRQVEAFVKQSFQRWKEFGKEGRRKKERILARDFTRGPPEENTKYLSSMGLIEETAASYAYSIRPIFAFHVAFRTLCAIKANSKKSVAVTEEFATMMAVTSSAVRLLSQGSAREDTEEDGEWLSD